MIGFGGANGEGNLEVRTFILRHETSMLKFLVEMKMAYMCVSRIGTKRHGCLESNWNRDNDRCCTDIQNVNRWWVRCFFSSLKGGSCAPLSLKASLTLPGPRLVMWGQAGSLLFYEVVKCLQTCLGITTCVEHQMGNDGDLLKNCSVHILYEAPAPKTIDTMSCHWGWASLLAQSFHERFRRCWVSDSAWPSTCDVPALRCGTTEGFC